MARQEGVFMKTKKSFLAAALMFLCGVTQGVAGVLEFDDWTSDNKGEGGSTSTKTYSFTVSAGATLSFDWSVSSESNCDKLTVVLDETTFLVDGASGVQSGSYSGEVAMGAHTLVVTYTKDGSVDQGEDQAKLFNVKVDAPDMAEIDGVSYMSTSNNTVVVVSIADTTDVIIPDTIVVDEVKYLVNEISATAFSACPNVTTVTIPNSVIEVKANTFENCKNLTNVLLPNTLTTIGDAAFKGCESMTSITIPNSVTTIGNNAFESCKKLAVVTLSNTLATIGNAAFKGCGSLREITIPNSVTTIGTYAFESCGTLGTATLSTALTSIGEGAFKNCISLASITDVPNTVTSISHSTFEGCAALAAINLPNALTFIGEAAFKGCTNLAAVTIPSTVTSIGGSAFQGCASLSTIALPNGVTSIGSRTFSECTNLTSIDIPQTMTSIGEYAFYNCENMQSMTIPKSVSWMGDYAFQGCGGEHYLNCNTYNGWGSGPYYNSKVTKVTIGEGVEVIGCRAFYYSTLLNEVILPSTVTSIEPAAFYATNLSTIELPAGIQSVYDNALPSSMSKMTCNAITPPTLLSESGSMTSLGNISIIYVPQGCGAAYKSVNPWASKVIIDGLGVTVEVDVTPGMMGEEILKKTNYLSDVNFLTLRGAINDEDIANLKYSMPNLLTIDMSGLDMKAIPSEMFKDRKALLSVILPNNVETIGYSAFFNCINLESMVFPEGLKTINGYEDYWNDYQGVFQNCTSLKSVSFPSTLETIGGHAFYYCTALKEVKFKSGLKTIGYRAFAGCGRLAFIEFSEGLTSINEFAFRSCSALKNLVFPKSLKSIAGGSFSECNSLETVVFQEGTTHIGYRYEIMYSADGRSEGYYSESHDTYEYGAFSFCSSLKQITLPQGLERIGKYTFSNCGNLTKIDIPEGVTYIGEYAFSSCNKLTQANLPSTLQSCNTTPFSGCSQLSDVTCLALLPPSLSSGLLSLDDMGLALKRTLYVPEWTLSRYKLTSGWAAFAEILPIANLYPSSINVDNDAVLALPTVGLPTNYAPDMSISASLNLRGTGTFTLDEFTLNSYYSQLLNEEATMTANKVNVKMSLSSYNYDSYNRGWYFLSFPFDVKLSDVTTNCEWVVRQYDGKARANNKLDNTWVTVPQTGTLNAGQGYIWACTGGSFTLPAVDNANKNLIFATTQRDIPLQEYAAELVSNSSWNLVGNPFPCYYNTNEMDYTAPITVWENNTYAAYSPVDDSYVLRPFEAFFVQCPAGVKSIGFKPEGRQLQSTSTTPATAPSRMQAKAERQVINLVLSNAISADRTRIVINNDAKMDYELTCDAAKFMSDDTNVPQIFSVSNGEIFAINERPMGNGIVKLGTHFGMAGTYTIAMQSASNMMVVLVDHKTGIEIDLTAGDYTFSAEAGDSDRFEVRMFADEETTAIDAVAADTKVVAISNAIVVTTSTDADVELYNAAGSLMAVGKGKSMTFDAAQGMYIVKVNGVSHKVAVVK